MLLPFEFFDFSENGCRTQCFGKIHLNYWFAFFHFSENGCQTRCFGKTLWPSCSLLERFWEPFEASSGTLGSSLGPLGTLLEASWGLLGCSWGLPGASCRLLGRLRGDPNVTKITCQKRVNFQNPKRRVDLRYGAPFWTPKSTKMASKTRQNLRRFSRTKKMLSKSLLEPSWADLGELRPPKSCSHAAWRSFFQKSHFL